MPTPTPASPPTVPRLPVAAAALAAALATTATTGVATAANIAPLGTGIIGTNDAIDTDAGSPLAQGGRPDWVNDGDLATREQTFNGGGTDPVSFVGVTWADTLSQAVTEVTLTMAVFFDGGWFGPNLSGPGTGGFLDPGFDLLEPVVQVSSDGGATWSTVAHTSDYVAAFDGHPLPDVDFGPPTTASAVFTLDPPATGLNALRIIGEEGGTASGGFIGVWEIEIEGVPADDTDEDGMDDSWETANGLNVGADDSALDADSDGLDNGAEFENLTDPQDGDSDDDGLADGDEVNVHLTDPNEGDSDGDGLSDGDEVDLHLTSPLLADSDGDGLDDPTEVTGTMTNPNLADSDGDGFGDGLEVAQMTDPLDAASAPANIALAGTALIGTNAAADGSPGTAYAHAGAAANITDGDLATRSDTFNGGTAHEANGFSHVGVTWGSPRTAPVERLIVTFATFFDGGWFGPNFTGPPAGGLIDPGIDLVEPSVQVTTDGGATWSDTPHTSDYLTALDGHQIGGGGNVNPSTVTATFDLDPPVAGIDGIRLIGEEGGAASGGFLGVFELDVRDTLSSDDRDGDRLSNSDETDIYGTDPDSPDSDGDGLQDGDEVEIHGTNPALADSDGDGFDDDVELTHSTDPGDPTSTPANLALAGTADIGTHFAIDGDPGTPYAHAGAASNLNDTVTGGTSRSDTWNGGTAHELNPYSYASISWPAPRPEAIETVTLTFATFFDGGWFGPNGSGPGAGGALDPTLDLSEPTVQVTTDGGTTWSDTPHTSDYLTALDGHLVGGNGVPNPSTATATFNLDPPVTNIDGIRVIGEEGGTASGGFLGLFEFSVGASTSGFGDGDSDGDGQSDTHELAAGTNPNDPNDFFRITGISTTGGQITVTWTSSPGRSYDIDTSTDLQSWSPLESGIPATGNSTSTNAGTVLPSIPTNHFRVRLATP